MDRRTTLAVVIATLALPRTVAGDRMRCIGYLSGGATPDETVAKPLARLGWVEGRNLRYEVLFSHDERDQVDAAARRLVRPDVDALLAWGLMKVRALATLTRTIPIVCGGTLDPVGTGLAATLRRPGSNITGLSNGGPESASITMGLYRALLPSIRRVVVTLQPQWNVPDLAEPQQCFISEARRAGISWEFAKAGNMRELDAVLSRLDPRRDFAWPMGFGDELARDMAAIGLRHRIAMDAMNPECVRQGMLMCYVYEFADRQRRLAEILDKVLRGANPAEIPFELPDRTRLVVNRATARAIGIVLPPEIVARASELID